MFKQGSYLFHKTSGVCIVDSISALPGVENSPLYYVLKPLYGEDKGNIIRVPTDSPSSLRELISAQKAKLLIDKWPNCDEESYIVDSKKRKQIYEDALKSGDIDILTPLLYGAKQRKIKDGHLNSMDGQFVARAEPLILGELSICLKMDYQDVASSLNKFVSATLPA